MDIFRARCSTFTGLLQGKSLIALLISTGHFFTYGPLLHDKATHLRIGGGDCIPMRCLQPIVIVVGSSWFSTLAVCLSIVVSMSTLHCSTVGNSCSNLIICIKSPSSAPSTNSNVSLSDSNDATGSRKASATSFNYCKCASSEPPCCHSCIAASTSMGFFWPRARLNLFLLEVSLHFWHWD